MYNWKAIKKIIIMLAVVFGIDLAVLILSLSAINKFTIIAIIILVVVVIYFTAIALKLLKELKKHDDKS